jgi:hypothetical protein
MKENIKKYRKEEAYQTPDDYFEKFAYRMQLAIGEEEKKTSWFAKMAYTFKLRWSIPLSLVVLLSFFGIWQDINAPIHLSDQDLMLFLAEENTDWWRTDELMVLAEQSQASTSISDEELLLYLNEESTENELIQSY